MDRRDSPAESARQESAEDYERLGQARFDNEGRFYGGYTSATALSSANIKRVTISTMGQRT